jgi:hypothetical protein
MRRLKGAISLFLLIIILAIYCLGGALVDLTRYKTAKSLVLTAQNSALNSCLTRYSKPLKETYGIFGFESNDSLDNTFEMHLLSSLHGDSARAFYGFDTEKITLVPTLPLTDYRVLRQQILEYSKYRYSVKIVEEVADKLQAVFQLMKAAKHFGGYMDVKQVEMGLVEKDLDIQSTLETITSMGKTPAEFEKVIMNYQERYPQVVQEMIDLEEALLILAGNLVSARESLSDLDSTIEVRNPDGSYSQKSNPAYKRVKKEIEGLIKDIESNKKKQSLLLAEKDQMIEEVNRILSFYEDLKVLNNEVLRLAQDMKVLIPELKSKIETNDGKLNADASVTSDPGESIHKEYVALLDKYNPEKIQEMITLSSQNIAVTSSLIQLLTEGLSAAGPSHDFAQNVLDQVAGYSSDFAYYKPLGLGLAEGVYQKSEFKTFTKLLKELTIVMEKRIISISETVTGQSDDPLKPYPDYHILPSYQYGASGAASEESIYGADVFKTKSNVLGTDVEDSASGLDLFRSMGESGADLAQEDALDKLLTGSLDMYEEALINEYILDHFNASCQTMMQSPDAYWPEGEVEYIVFGSKTPRHNIRYAEASIFTLRLLPNSLSYFIFKRTEMDTAASVCSAPFPPLLPVLKVALPIIAGTVESLSDVKTLHLGESVPLFKLEADLMMDFDFKTLGDVNVFLRKLIVLIGPGDSISTLPGVTPAKKSQVTPTNPSHMRTKDNASVNLGDFNIHFDYEDYMRLLLFSQSITEEQRGLKIMRVADVMHMNLEKTIDAFDFKRYYTRLNSHVDLNMDFWFISSNIFRQIRKISKQQLLNSELERGY